MVWWRFLQYVLEECGVVYFGVVCCGLNAMVWCNLWCGVMWCGIVWCSLGVFWCGVIWFDYCGVVLYGVMWSGVV